MTATGSESNTDAEAEDLPVTVADTSNTSRRSRSSRSRHRRRFFFGSSKHRESNIFAAVANMTVVVLICTALTEPQWFYLRGGGCRDGNEHSINYLGMNHFIVQGRFIDIDARKDNMFTKYEYGTTHKDVLIDCVTHQLLRIMHAMLGMCFVAILMSLIAFLFDLSGVTCKVLKQLREFGVFSIITVLLCVLVNSFCYWATENLEQLQKQSKLNKGSKVQVEFSVSYYLMAAAGAMAVISTACNLLRRPSSSRSNRHRGRRDSHHRYQRLPSLPDESDMLNQIGLLSEDEISSMQQEQLPPPYSP